MLKIQNAKPLREQALVFGTFPDLNFEFVSELVAVCQDFRISDFALRKP
jgi:hypothetical protein